MSAIIADTLKSGRADHKLAFADQIWDEGRQCFVSEYNFDDTLQSSDKTIIITPSAEGSDLSALVACKSPSVDDYARIKYGGTARIPTVAEWQELLDNTTQTLSRVQGPEGLAYEITFTGTNGNSIYLLYFHDNGFTGRYWTADLDINNIQNAKSLEFSTDGLGGIEHSVAASPRYQGLAIKAVSTTAATGFVDLGLPSGLKWLVSSYQDFIAWGDRVSRNLGDHTLQNYSLYDESTSSYKKYNTQDRIIALENGDLIKGYLIVDSDLNILKFVDVNGYEYPCLKSNVKSIQIDSTSPITPVDGNIVISSDSILSNLVAGYGVNIASNIVSVKTMTDEDIDEICI